MKICSAVLFGVILIACEREPANAAPAPEYVELTSEAYPATGNARELTERAATCIARDLAPGVQGGELIISNDPANGVIVANNAVEYPDGLNRWQLRSRFVFEAKDGRFRVQQTNVEQFYGGSTGWAALGKWKFSGWEKAQAALQVSSEAVARCVQSQAEDKW